MNRFRSVLFALCGLSLVAVVACGDDADEITNTITCGDVCQRYADCFDDDYDVEACTDRCEDDATPDEEKEAELEECDACIEDQSCTGALVECTAECAQFVP
jgi:hypothetical protein